MLKRGYETKESACYMCLLFESMPNIYIYIYRLKLMLAELVYPIKKDDDAMAKCLMDIITTW